MKMRVERLVLACVVILAACCWAGDNQPPQADPTALKDIADDPLRQDIVRVVEQKIMQGYADGSFKPKATVTTAEFAAVVERMIAACPSMKKLQFDSTDDKESVSRLRAVAVVIRSAADLTAVESIVDPNAMLEKCSDRAQIPAWGLKFAAFAVDHGYFRVDTQFRPNDPITRAELAGVLARCLPPGPGASVEQACSGLRVDCRGLGLKRSMSPVIVAEDGKHLYPDPKNLPSIEFIEEHGLASWVHEAAADKRCGEKPLEITAVRCEGPARNTVVITDQDRDAVLAEEAKGHFLARWSVTFIIDQD